MGEMGAGRYGGMLAGLLAAILTLLPLAAAAGLSGRAPVVRMPTPTEVYPQNYDVAQDGAGVVYVGNYEGVLIHDGSRWSKLQLPNGERARSLLYDRGRRVYVGGYDLFGYIERGGHGAEVFHDLTPLFAEALAGESFADIWDIHLGAEGVFFRALNHVFLYRPDGGSGSLWRHAGRFGAIAGFGGRTVLQFRGAGLKVLDGTQWEALQGTESLHELIYQLLPLPSGGLLTMSSDGIWREYRDGSVRRYPAPRQLPAPSLLSRGLPLADGTLALAGTDGQLYLFDAGQGTVRHFEVGQGVLSGLIRARDGGLFTASDEALIHIAWPSPWSVIDRAQGLGGSLLGISRWGERWLVLSGQGVYESSAAGHFERQPWSDHEIWDVLPLDRERALLADSYTLKLIRGGRATAIAGTDVYARLLQRSRTRADVVFVGTETGLMVVQLGQGGARLLRPDGSTGSQVNSVVETADGLLWLGTERDGVRRLRLSADLARVDSDDRFGAEAGLRFGSLAVAGVFLRRDGQLYATTEAGIFRWDGARFVADPLDGLAQLRSAGEILTLTESPQGELWAFSDRRVFQRLPGGNWRREELGGVLKGALQDMEFEPDGSVVLASSGAVLRRETAVPVRSSPPELLLRSVEMSGGNARALLPLQPEATPEFVQQGLASLVFRIALPEYRREAAARYQARLAGFSDQFSEWSEVANYTFRRLEPGEYRFEARAQDALGQVSELPPFRFLVLPPWHGTVWGRLLLLALGLALLGTLNVLIVRARTARLQAQTAALERMVAQRTRELESANRQLQEMAHLDGLTEIPNRRRLDDYLSEVWQQCAAQQRTMSVLIIDGDHYQGLQRPRRAPRGRPAAQAAG
jgi:hypothetical protein